MARLFLSTAAVIMSAFTDGEITGEGVKMLIPHLAKSHALLKYIQATLTWLLPELYDFSFINISLNFTGKRRGNSYFE